MQSRLGTIKGMVTRDELDVVERELSGRWSALVGLAARVRCAKARQAVVAPAITPEEKHGETPVVILGNGVEADELRAALAQQDIQSEVAISMKEALALTERTCPWLLVVDEAFVGDSFNWRQLRRNGHGGLVVLGSRSDVEGWLRVAEVDADAYLRKGVGMAEKVARLRAVMRRCSPHGNGNR